MKTYSFIENFCRKPSVSADSYEERLEALRDAIRHADHVIVGAGAGLSTAAGLQYSGKRYADNFGDFISRYGIEDMYSAMFYPFVTEEERWAYQARHVLVNRYENKDAVTLYSTLHRLVADKDHFVITTNVDGLFEKSGFSPERIFATQGDYAYMQCAEGCHDRLYYNENLVRSMARQTEQCRIPPSLVPHCPVCGGSMALHVRKDGYFIEDSHWHEALRSYQAFLQKAVHGSTLLLELGVGYNTPTIIRFPFERMAAQSDNITLVRINRDFSNKQATVRRFIPFGERADKVLTDLEADG